MKKGKKERKERKEKGEKTAKEKAAKGCRIMQPLLSLQQTRRILTYGGYFEAFMETLTEKVQEKILYGLLLLKTQDRLSKKFVKLIKDGIYELRTEFGGNIYRVFFIFDEGQIVVLFNGFQKKTQKTPANEIEKAIKIKEAYYADKQSQNR